MKLRNFLLCISAAAVLSAGCVEDNRLQGEPSLALNPAELSFEEPVAASQTITLSTTREWMVKGELPEWIDINPMSGNAVPDGMKIDVTVTDNPGTDRSASIEFTIGTIKKNLAISQKGEGGSADALVVYHNDFDKERADKGTSWAAQTLDVNETWKNAAGSGSSAVTYSFSGMTVRNGSGLANSSNDGNSSSLYAGSGVNNLFFAKDNYFQVKNITLDASKRNYVLSFGSIRSVFNAEEGGSVFDADQFSAYISRDGAKWVKLAYTFASGSAPDAKWDKLSSTFTLPAGTSALYLYFTTTEASTYRIDDLDLSVSSAAGTAIDFSKGVELGGGGSTGGEVVGTPEGNGTEASPYNVAAALAATKALAADTPSDEVYIKGIISTISEIDTGNYGNATYYISDDGTAAGQFEIFRGYYLNGDKFTAADQIKVGDNVVVYGKLVNYKGNTPEVNAGSKIISLNGKTEDGTLRFSVFPASLTVSAEAESATFKVNGNVAWTASVTEGSDWLEIIYGDSGNGQDDVVLQLKKNESETDARTAKVKVSTTADVTTKEYVVAITQLRKSSGSGGDATLLYTLDSTGSLKGSNNSYAGNCDIEADGITWNVNGNTQMNPWRLGGKSITDTDRTVYSKTPFGKALTKVVLTLGTASGITLNSCKLVYSTNADFSSSTEVPFDYIDGEIELTGADGFPADCYYKFIFNVTVSGTSNKFVQFKKVEFYGAE